MRAFGYSKRNEINESDLMEMSEITIVASRRQLKVIADFILKSAAELPDSLCHKHLRDHVAGFSEAESDLIIMLEDGDEDTGTVDGILSPTEVS